MNSRKYVIFVACLFLCSGIVSCAKKEVSEKTEPDYSIVPMYKDNISKADDELDTLHQLQQSSEENRQETIQNTADELYDFTGIKSEKSYGTGNLNTNYKHSLISSAIVCPDKNNDCIYYVNVTKDNYIYRYKDGISQLLVEQESDSLFLWENKLYFIAIKDDQYIRTLGDIYMYDIDRKELSMVREGEIYNLYLDQYGMQYNEMESEDGEIYFVRYSHKFQDNSPEKMLYTYAPSYNEYRIMVGSSETILLNEDTDERIQIAPGFDTIFNPRLSEHYFSYQIQDSFYVINLLDGASTEVNMNKLKSLPIIEMEGYRYFDYIIFNDTLFWVSSSVVYEYSLVDGTLREGIQIKSEDNHRIISLYTDGEILYSLVEIPEQTLYLSEIKFVRNTGQNTDRRELDNSLVWDYVIEFEDAFQ